MRTLVVAAAAVAAAAVAALLAVAGVDATSTDPAQDARGALIAAFARRPLVAFAEEHHNRTQHHFLQELVRDPRFPDAVDDIVVEFGNARYQRLVDRWILNRRPV